jgi:hypothetical protein
MRRMNSTLKGLRPTVGLRRPKNTLRVGEGRRLARKGAPNEFGLQGRRPTVGLRRPERHSLRRRRPTLGAQAPQKADFNRREGLRPTVGFTRRMNSTLKGLRPTVGLRRPKNSALRVGEGRRPARKRLRRPISIGAKAFGQRSACAPNEFGLQGPSANGRPAPTEKYSPRRRRPTPGAQAPQKADFNRREGLRPAVGRPVGQRSAPTEKYSPRRRRPTPGAQAPQKADFNRREGLRPTVGLRRPKKRLSASAKADARRVAPQKADFNRREGLRPTVGLRRPKNTLRVGEGRRPARKRREGRFQSARRPTPGAL